MKYKTAELESDALDYLVQCTELQQKPLSSVAEWAASNDAGYSPSTNWEQGGRIIERKHIELHCHAVGGRIIIGEWCARSLGGRLCFAKTPLIAAMRAYVGSKFGDEVELP